MKAERITNSLIMLGSAIVGGTVFFKSFFYTVDPGERYLIFDRLKGGLRPQIYGEGMHFYMPFYQTPIKYEIRLQSKTISTQTGTKDLQSIDIAVRMLFKPIPEQLPNIHINQGPNYEEKILPSIGNEVLKAVVAKYDADQLLKNREQISQQIQQQLIQRANDFHINLDDVSIIHLSFMKEYAAAIEQKQVAQQMAERQKYIVMKSEEEKKAEIIKAEGEAESAKLINESVQKHGNALIQIRRLETAKYIAKTLAKNPNISYIPSSNGLGNLINLSLK